MTTLACNTKEMACDLQLTLGQRRMTKCHTKIYKVAAHELHYPEDFIIGFCGAASEHIDVIDFYMRPELYKSLPRTRDTSGLILTKSGAIFIFDSPSKWIRITEKYTSAGSGADVAMGALHAGATPKQAILAATKTDPFTGMGVKTLSF